MAILRRAGLIALLTFATLAFTATFASAIANDSDGDGIENSIDLQPTEYSAAFSDEEVEGTEAPTWGEIVDRGGLEVSITDIPAPGGVSVRADPTAAEEAPLPPGATRESTLSGCDEEKYELHLQLGTQANVKCGSETISVLQGEAQVTVDATTVAVPEGGEAKVIANDDGTVTVENLGNGGDKVTVTTVTEDGDVVQQIIKGGETVEVSQTQGSTNTPNSASDCNDGGWENYSEENGTPFKNQGDCVSYVATGGRNEAAG